MRSSTADIPDTTANSIPREDADAFEASFNFYSDPEAERLLRAETLLNACDRTDLRLMDSLMKGASLDSLEQELFLTASALQYRKRRLMNISGCTQTADFLAFMAFCRDKKIL